MLILILSQFPLSIYTLSHSILDQDQSLLSHNPEGDVPAMIIHSSASSSVCLIKASPKKTIELRNISY